MVYSPIVLDHFKSPRNVGEIPDADGLGGVGNPVCRALGGPPPNKLHCPNLGADALHSAIKNYLDRKAGKKVPTEEDREPHLKQKGEGCYCPYCEKKVEEESPFCIFCGSEMPHEHDH